MTAIGALLRSWLGAALVSGLAAVVWFILATMHPSTTYHLGPFLVAVAWPVARRWQRGFALAPLGAVTGSLGGAAIAAGTTAVLAARHSLAGPNVLGSPSALGEIAIAIAVGAAFGMAIALRRTRPDSAADGPGA